MEILSSSKLSIPLKGEGCLGVIELVGSKEEVQKYMAYISTIIKNEILREREQEILSISFSVPAPCNGCGN